MIDSWSVYCIKQVIVHAAMKQMPNTRIAVFEKMSTLNKWGWGLSMIIFFGLEVVCLTEPGMV